MPVFEHSTNELWDIRGWLWWTSMNKLFDLIFSGREGTSSKYKHAFRIKNSTTFCVACNAKVSHKIHREKNYIL